MSHAYSVKQSEEICKTLNALRLWNFLSDVYLEHVKPLTRSVFMLGYKGKVVNAEVFSEKHRTTVAHFLNNGRWDRLHFEKALKRQVIDRIYEGSRKSGAPVFCIVDDTIASHTAPSSQVMHPIEAVYYHQSHLKKQQDYGHQAVGVMLSYNELSLNYAIVLYCLLDEEQFNISLTTAPFFIITYRTASVAFPTSVGALREFPYTADTIPYTAYASPYPEQNGHEPRLFARQPAHSRHKNPAPRRY